MDTNHDLKTTILGIIAGLFTVLAACGVHIPGILQSQTVEGIIAGIAAAMLGYYTNKGKGATTTTATADEAMGGGKE